MKQFPVAVQPYTFRAALASDYAGALTRVAAIGYRGIELSPPPAGMTYAAQKGLLDHLGLSVIGCHAGFDTLTFDPDALADYLDVMEGGRCITISLRFTSREDILHKAQSLNALGQRCHARGCQLLYHNHDWEFQEFDGAYALDILLQETDPSLVQTELDTYWIQKGGVDPVRYLQKLRGRAPRLHIKDMEVEPSSYFAEIGTGRLDFLAIAEVAADIGVEWLVVEQDESRRDPFESLAISYDNLKKLEILQA